MIGIIAVAMVTVGVFLIPRQIETPPDEWLPSAVTDTVTPVTESTEQTEPPGDSHVSELLKPIVADFSKGMPYKVDLDGDDIEDTITVTKGNSADTLDISSSRFGEYRTVFNYTFEPGKVSLLAIDTGNRNYSLCVSMDTGGQGGTGSMGGLILYGTADGWNSITSLLSVSFAFNGEIPDNQTFIVRGDTGYSEQFEASNLYVEKGIH